MNTGEIGWAELQEQHVATRRATVTTAGIRDFVGPALKEVAAAVAQQGRTITGPPFVRYRTAGEAWEVAAGFPVDAAVADQDRVEAGVLPGGPVAHAVYRGPYEGLGAAYQKINDAIRAAGDRVTADPWECYLDDATATEPRTHIFIPCTHCAWGA